MAYLYIPCSIPGSTWYDAPIDLTCNNIGALREVGAEVGKSVGGVEL